MLLIGLKLLIKDKYENNTDQSPISILKRGEIYQIFIFVCTESFPCVPKVSEKQISMAEDKELFEMCSEGKIEELRKALARGTNPNKKLDTNGNTALHAAAGFGHLGVVALLLEQPGIDWNQTCNIGSTAFHFAASQGHQEILTHLLASPKTDTNVEDQDGNTPIMILLKSNLNIDIQGNCLQVLVDCNKVDLDVKDPDGDGLEDLAR